MPRTPIAINGFASFGNIIARLKAGLPNSRTKHIIYARPKMPPDLPCFCLSLLDSPYAHYMPASLRRNASRAGCPCLRPQNINVGCNKCRVVVYGWWRALSDAIANKSDAGDVQNMDIVSIGDDSVNNLLINQRNRRRCGGDDDTKCAHNTIDKEVQPL
jgi:hypothetical protein